MQLQFTILTILSVEYPLLLYVGMVIVAFLNMYTSRSIDAYSHVLITVIHASIL